VRIESWSAYLNDHLAGSIAGVEIARRCAQDTDDQELKQALRRMMGEIDEDRLALTSIMAAMNVTPSIKKQALATVSAWISWATASAGLGDQEVRRLRDLEALCVGVWGKRLLWGALARLPADQGTVASSVLDRLARRAEDQEKRLVALRERFLERTGSAVQGNRDAGF
jgi:hypothetical protein